MTTLCKRDDRRGALIAGPILIIVGAALLLTKTGVLAPELLRQWWPLLLIAIGGSLVFRRWRRDKV